jgi:hypothetical protein
MQPRPDFFESNVMYAFSIATGCELARNVLLAAHHRGDGAGAVFTAILAIVGAIITFIAAMNKSQNAVWRNGLPYCPNCRRQISLKSSRPHCRSCGYNLVQSPHRPNPTSGIPSNAALLVQEAERKRRVKEQEELEERLRQVREQHEREAEALRVAADAARRERQAKRQATIEANGGYTDLQLIGFGVCFILVPLSIISLLVYMANH